jgi:hypothetical protein
VKGKERKEERAAVQCRRRRPSPSLAGCRPSNPATTLYCAPWAVPLPISRGVERKDGIEERG